MFLATAQFHRLGTPIRPTGQTGSSGPLASAAERSLIRGRVPILG
jgi:hypothetical protein